VTTYNYSARRIFADYFRTGLGMTLTAVPLSLPDLHAFFQALFGAAFIFFSIYGIATVKRHVTQIHVTEQGVSLKGPEFRGFGSATVNWLEISDLKLAYFSTSRDGSNGWMQLSLTGARKNIKIESRLDGFQKIARLAVNSAQANHLTLDPATIDNLIALGIPSNVTDFSKVSGKGAHVISEGTLA
jgi:hypothetical protein